MIYICVHLDIYFVQYDNYIHNIHSVCAYTPYGHILAYIGIDVRNNYQCCILIMCSGLDDIDGSNVDTHIDNCNLIIKYYYYSPRTIYSYIAK